MNRSQIVVGVGSTHGDDQAGWFVVDELRRLMVDETVLRKARTPVDVVDWLSEFDSVHIVDAAVGAVVSFNRLEFADPVDRTILQHMKVSSTHDFNVFKTLQLAESLDVSLRHVIIWLVAASEFEPMTEISEKAVGNSQQCAIQIQRELSHA